MNLVTSGHPLRHLVGMELAEIERRSLELPQVKCDVVHRFGPGICIREVTIPANTLAVGHYQNFEHTNIMLKGRVTILNENGSFSELVAPLQFVGKPGRKIGYIHEDMVWLNIFATDETDVAKIEDHFISKSEAWKNDAAVKMNIARLSKQPDRDDYSRVLLETGFTENIARAQSENVDDQIPLGSVVTVVQDSPIEGKGLFATCDIEAGAVIAPARVGTKRAQAGRFTNHSATPNACMVSRGENIDLVALVPISGCKGGQPGDEITIDYRQAMQVARLQ